MAETQRGSADDLRYLIRHCPIDLGSLNTCRLLLLQLWLGCWCSREEEQAIGSEAASAIDVAAWQGYVETFEGG